MNKNKYDRMDVTMENYNENQMNLNIQQTVNFVIEKTDSLYLNNEFYSINEIERINSQNNNNEKLNYSFNSDDARVCFDEEEEERYRDYYDELHDALFGGEDVENIENSEDKITVSKDGSLKDNGLNSEKVKITVD